MFWLLGIWFQGDDNLLGCLANGAALRIKNIPNGLEIIPPVSRGEKVFFEIKISIGEGNFQVGHKLILRGVYLVKSFLNREFSEFCFCPLQGSLMRTDKGGLFPDSRI